MPEQARAAHYIVCATLDDVIRNTPWGGSWAVDGLVSTFHQDVQGGERVFDLLAHFQRNARVNRDLLLLIYLCLSLGYEGRTRVESRGATELAQTRESLFRVLRTEFDIVERDLSPLWQGEDAAHSPAKRGAVFWLVTGLVALALLALFVTLTTLLNGFAQGTLEEFAGLPPGEVPSLAIAEPPPEPTPLPPMRPVEQAPPPTPIDAPAPPVIEDFIGFIQPEVEDGLVELFRQDNAVLIRISNFGVFASGEADIEPEFVPVFDRIGRALAPNNFEIIVIGHTDSRPISDPRFPNNQFLSNARANAVRDVLLGFVDEGRVEIQGRGAQDLLIDPEVTEDDFATNRRTEILVLEAGAEVPPGLLSQGAQNGPATQIEVSQ